MARRLSRMLRWALALVLTLVVAVLVANRGYYLGGSASGQYCTTCHQIQAPHDRAAASAHRTLDCKECHGAALTTNLELHKTNLRHLWYQVSGRIPDRVRLKDAQVDFVASNCRRCHASQFARWTAGGHSVAFDHIFLSRAHNSKTRLMDDCLRCHGMFVDGNVTSIVQPIDNVGPWTLVRDHDRGRPTIPCLACHSMHARGTPLKAGPNYLEPRTIAYGRVVETTSLAFYDRRERRHVPAADLPLPAMTQDDRPVVMSTDRRQRVCYQCHAPEATRRVHTGDDRTATGVHEGIGCLGCHDPHALDAKVSCANCHPASSNCGLDVTTMDTTFKTAGSAHDIHRVACADCHPKGVPPPKAGTPRAARVAAVVAVPSRKVTR